MARTSTGRCKKIVPAALPALVAIVALVSSGRLTSAQAGSHLRINAISIVELRQWDSFVDTAERARDLRLRTAARDPMMPTRIVERFEQVSGNVRVWGVEMVRDSEQGVALSIFGEFVANAAGVDTQPALSVTAASAAFAAIGPSGQPGPPELVLLPQGETTLRLAYQAVVETDDGPFRVFVDANSGAEIQRLGERQTQAAVGSGMGVLGDVKKISVLQTPNGFLTDDQLRPPLLTTYDMRGNLARTVNVIENHAPLFSSDLASDADNSWNAPPQVDAHVYAGWTYDYYYKRFGRRGLDDRDRPLVVMTNAVAQQAWRTVSARRRRARAHARRDRFDVAPDLCRRVGRVERGVLRHHGHLGRVLLPDAGQRTGPR